MPEKENPSQQLLLKFPAQPRYSFANYIESDGSKFAAASAKDICAEKTSTYNTLYLSGAKGLGKTHLLLAIGNRLAETQPDKKTLYVHCDDFIQNIQSGDSASTNQAVSQLIEVDFFLLDDADHISGHHDAQEKLYLIYNELTERGKKMVFAGRQTPTQLTDTENYLKSRFKWGLTAEIKPIDDLTTAKILKKLGQDVELEIPDKIISYLMNRIPRDFQSIKNTVEKINEESYIQKKKVSLQLVKTALHLS